MDFEGLWGGQHAILAGNGGGVKLHLDMSTSATVALDTKRENSHSGAERLHEETPPVEPTSNQQPHRAGSFPPNNNGRPGNEHVEM
jgi:hypothetical protein